jgi:hypothetical protein
MLLLSKVFSLSHLQQKCKVAATHSTIPSIIIAKRQQFQVPCMCNNNYDYCNATTNSSLLINAKITILASKIEKKLQVLVFNLSLSLSHSLTPLKML